ncbi:MAG: dihydrolipoyl dehydrogenase [Verrucomicrobia bacterium]|nr:dihydrolipoyl dehydrogenase [Verrucomicrobiota bacterium]
MSKEARELVVIGGGPGGYPAAFYASDLGMKVTVIDKELNPGGVCLFKGCIPSKALLHVAKLLNESKEAAEWGVTFGETKVDLDKLRSYKEGVVKKLTGGLGMLSKQRNVDFIQGTAEFIDSHNLKVTRENGKVEEMRFEKAIIATGSRPTKVPGLSIDSPRVVDSTGALELPFLPKNMLVIGGGYIGLEMGSVYHSIGSEVSVVEMTSHLLPSADRDLVQPLEKRLRKQFKDIKLKTKVAALEDVGDTVKVTFEDEKGKKTEEHFEMVLISIGRRPNSQGFGLENTGVKVNDRGWIETDNQRRTHESHIWAIGDVAGEPMLAHKATYEGKVAIQAIQGKRSIYDPAAIPAVVFTDPEIAWAGITELEAKDQGIAVKVSKFPWSASGRATTLDRSDGLTKLITHPETEQILGIGICGPGAGELIAEGTLAIEMGATVEDLSLTIHPHPTLSETMMESAEVYYGHSPHFFQPKKKK